MLEPQGQLTIRTDGGADELFRLYEWFNDDDELRGRVSLPSNQIRPGQMGELTEALVVAVGAGGIATALARSLTTWFTVRRSEVTITLKRDNNTEITIDAKRIKLPEVTQAVQQMIERPVDPL
ncbi:effector-associated constant component EACC1 [Nocardia sp. bgisy134]|uniref:effector-associated constant component EACC1 n=1 Tax=Nocardia sp. bgisy134 TaxID=3413789 RepID=UPI003D733146